MLEGTKFQEEPIHPPPIDKPIDDPTVKEQPTSPLRQVPMEQCMLRDNAMPNLEAIQGSIYHLVINANNFEIKPTMIQMLHKNLQFRVSMNKNPNQHLKRFLTLCDTFKYNGVIDDAIHLRLFPCSLTDDAFM